MKLDRSFAALVCLMAAGAVAAQASKSLSTLQVKQAVEARKAIYVLTSRNLAPLAAMAQGKLAFNSAEALKRAQRLRFMAEMAHEAYPAGSLGASSRATSRVWEEWPDFERRLRELSSLSGALVTALQGDPKAGADFSSAVSRISATCKGCHERFRSE